MSFREEVEKGLGAVVILAGSDSDEAHVRRIAEALGKYNLPFDVRFVSAHKQPDKIMELIEEYESMKGPLVYISVAGKTDALSGMVSYHSVIPVISCPPDGILNQTCLTNPQMSSNATIYNTTNVARFIAQMFSYANPLYAEEIMRKNAEKELELGESDIKLRNDMSSK